MTPVGDALSLLFKGTPYSYRFDPDVLADEPVTLNLKNVSFRLALRSLLDAVGLTYRKSGNTYYISKTSPAKEREFQSRGWAPPSEQWRTPIPGKHRMLYLTRYGDRTQLRVRVFPYEGSETILWESPEDSGNCYPLPSPSFTRVAIISAGDNLFVLNLDSATTERIAREYRVQFAVWKDDDTLSLLAADHEYRNRSELSFDFRTRNLTVVKTLPPDFDILSFLEAAFDKPIRAIKELVRNGRFSMPFDEQQVGLAVLRGAGLPRRHPMYSEYILPSPMVALSPDGQYVALTTGQDVIFIIWLGEELADVVRVIPLTTLVNDEHVQPYDLHWSADSEYLTFTEVHYHPAQFYAADLPPSPDPLDWTYLVRMYTHKSGQVSTLAVGRSAFLIPETKSFAQSREEAGSSAK